MKILLHICCAPCSIYPVKILRREGLEVFGFFYNHNIHPYSECVKRRETLADYADSINLRVIYQKEYNLEEFIRNVVFREADRCSYCYHDRLRSAALIAKRGKFDYFSSTLLYSKFQKHKMIQSIGQSIGKSLGVPFLYLDFRKGWKEGIEESKCLGLYRQQYCGCIYSEKERFYRLSHK
ncbi:epoxyqueuosine reductase [Desulfosarcina sp. BuS5]|uniref:epoxyqueuosine reductase QueH n=1 Tax=Desulfosarcina sp. BuS5 TaxID=933262 RepID=UPI00047FC800|nr:epoxyqueuosine reductase QueH [Desulfosarcina sp. BuS5]WDN89989.1 epoxyqueuosine reductase [Desulfosarcina sp. BuS5]